MPREVKQPPPDNPAKPLPTEPYGRRERRVPRPVTTERLKRQALYYLERYNATAAGLSDVLQRRVARAAREHPDTDRAQAAEWIKDIVAHCVQLGLVNDASFALSRARSLLRSGKSKRAVAYALRAKGVGECHIASAFERLGEEADPEPDAASGGSQADLDLMAARAYVRKRRLGGYRTPVDAARHDKDLAALARRGFGYGLARQVLDESMDGLGDDTDDADVEN